MDKDIMYGLSVTFVVWVAAIAWSSSRMIYNNWQAFLDVRHADPDELAKMALWAAVPIWMCSMLFARITAIWHIGFGHWSGTQGIFTADIHVSMGLVAAALSLFWAYDRTYGHRLGRTLWCHHIWFGLLAGAITSILSWVF